MPTVFVVQDDPQKNLTPAKKFGRLVPVFDPGYQVTISSEFAVDQATEILSSFSKEDYLLLVGDPVLIGICCAVIAKKLKYFSMLKWDRQERKYWNIPVDIRELVSK